MRRKIVGSMLVVPLFLGLLTAGLNAQWRGETRFDFGLRGGFGLDPSQLVLGLQFSFGREDAFYRIAPSIDVGFGSNSTTIAFNGDFLLSFSVENTSVSFYGGAGPTLIYYSRKEAESSWGVGLTPVFGTQVALTRRFMTNLEARIGIGSLPDFRLVLALMF